MALGNPFNISGDWYKGNLHVHTTNSDGLISAEEVVKRYRDNGYSFLAITDHNLITDASEYSSQDFLLIRGTELDVDRTELGDTFHLIGFDMRDGVELPKSLDVQQTIDFLIKGGGKVFVAHPYWSGLTAKDMISLEGYLGVEVFNTGCQLEIAKGISSVHWDDLLARGKRLWGFAVDDAHWRTDDGFKGWIMVKAVELTKPAIVDAIEKGYFYSSCGPWIYNIELDDRHISVKCSAVKKINFVCNTHRGKSFQAKDEILTFAEHTLKGDEKYVRIECIDGEGNIAWSNPLFL